MNLAIDIGNSFCKAALFSESSLHELKQFPSDARLAGLFDWLEEIDFTASILASVADVPVELAQLLSLKGPFIEMRPDTPQALVLDYATPRSLGVDRLAASNAAHVMFPDANVLVVNAGTCITYDIVDRGGVYRGGAISPGIVMRLKAMHTFTARLPLVQGVNQTGLSGKSTEESMLSGAINGARSEVAGMAEQFGKEYPELLILLSGGDLPFFAVPNIVLIGLNEILQFNIKADAHQ
jgi:type III pantothenate kinase